MNDHNDQNDRYQPLKPSCHCGCYQHCGWSCMTDDCDCTECTCVDCEDKINIVKSSN